MEYQINNINTEYVERTYTLISSTKNPILLSCNLYKHTTFIHKLNLILNLFSSENINKFEGIKQKELHRTIIIKSQENDPLPSNPKRDYCKLHDLVDEVHYVVLRKE